MSTSLPEEASDLATGSPTQPEPYYLDPREWVEVPPADWPTEWPDDEMIMTDEVEPCL